MAINATYRSYRTAIRALLRSKLRDKEVGILRGFKMLLGRDGSDYLEFPSAYYRDTKTFTTLAEAVTDIGDDETTLLVSNVLTVSASYEIPRNITPKVVAGGSFALSAGAILTMPVPEAGDHQIFSGDGTVAFSRRTTSRISAAWWGLNGDNQKFTDGAMTNGSAVLTAVGSRFTAADVGKAVSVAGAGAAGAVLRTSIASFSSGNSVTLAAAAATTVSGASFDFGTDDTDAIQAALDALPHGCDLVFPRPEYSYRTEAVLELADKNSVNVYFSGAVDTASVDGYYPFTFCGAATTGYENPALRIVGCSYSDFYGWAVDQNDRVQYPFWFSGVNFYPAAGDGGVLRTSNRRRSIQCKITNFANLPGGTTLAARGGRIGDLNGGSSQTDTLTVHGGFYRAIETTPQISIDAVPTTRGLELFGANTYALFFHPEASGDCCYFINDGTYTLVMPYGLGGGRSPFYLASNTASVKLVSPHGEGILGRPVSVAEGNVITPRTFSIDKGTFLPGSKGVISFDASIEEDLTDPDNEIQGINLTTNTLYIANHGKTTGQVVGVELDGGTFPTVASPVTDGEALFVEVVDANHIQLKRTSGGAVLDLTALGTGSINLHQGFDCSTAVNTTTDRIYMPAHGLVTDDTLIAKLGSGTFPVVAVPITDGQKVYAIRVDADYIQISKTLGGSAENFTGTGTGPISLRWQAPAMRFLGNMNVSLKDTLASDILFGNSGGYLTKPVFKDDMCTWLYPTDHSQNPDIYFFRYSNSRGAQGGELQTYIPNLKAQVVDMTAGGETMGAGWSGVHALVVNDGTAKNVRLPRAYRGMSVFVWKLGTGTLTVLPGTTSGEIRRHDTGAAAATSISAPLGSDFGCIRFDATENGIWRPSSTMALAYDGGAAVLTATATWDPGNMAADGDVVSTTIAVPGLVPADKVVASHDQIGANNVLISAHCQAAGTARVVLMNKTGGALNIASGTLSVKGFK